MHAARRVVLTRTTADNALLRTLLPGLDAELVDHPCIAIELLSPPIPIADDLRAGRYDAAIFVSRHAVEALLAIPLPPPEQVLAIGTATAEALTSRGWPVTAVPSEARSEIAARELDALLPGVQRVLSVRGDLGGDVLRNALESRQIAVDEAIVYRTRPQTPAPLAPFEGETLVVLASPSAAEVFFKQDGLATHLLCIGQTTAAACAGRGLPTDVAPESSREGLARAIRAGVER